MAGTFIPGERKVRPGAYFNVQKKAEVSDGIMNGVTAVIFRSDFGPLNTAVELSAENGYEEVFGTGLTTRAIMEAIAGGANMIIACRVGSGGTPGTISLKDADGEDALIVTVKYPGNKAFAVSIREKLSDNTLKECIFYDDVTVVEKVEFASGDGEAGELALVLANSKYFDVQLLDGKDTAQLATITQSAFTKGTNPDTTVDDYSNAFAQVEPYEFNTICVDTEDLEIHLLLQSFVSRIYDAGYLVQAVVAENHTVDLETRMKHAAAFNDEKMNYVLNAWVNEQGTEIDGYQTAARLAGMIGAVAANVSLTHTVINGFSELLEKLTNTDMITAEQQGCIVLSYNRSKQIWIDNAINTLVTPSENQDDGWKKIRRVKTRFELIRRINAVAENLIGKVDNDTNGKATVISQMQNIGDLMREEGKLVACAVTENSAYKDDGDSAWFDIDVIDKDSMEHIYLTFLFRFSTSE